MKRTKTFNYCELCDRAMDAESPPTREQYEAGLIHIQGDSSVLLPNAVVKRNHKTGHTDSHAKTLDGYYCNYDCLLDHIKDILRI